MQNIPIELLRTFVKVVETGSFTRAGAMVGRSQSAVSLQVRRLESFLDAQLFVRDPRRTRLTDEGRALVEYAQRILTLNDEILNSLRKPKVAGSVCLGAPHEYVASLLMENLGKFAQSHPAVMLDVTCDLSKNLLMRWERGEFDVVIALHDDPDKGAGTTVFTEPLVWITSADYLRHEQRPLPLVVAQEPCIYRSSILQTLSRTNQPWQITYTNTSYAGISAAVRAGLGVTALTGSTTPSGVRQLGERDGFPLLGEVDVRLHTKEKNASEAIQCVADYIASSFVTPDMARFGDASIA